MEIVHFTQIEPALSSPACLHRNTHQISQSSTLNSSSHSYAPDLTRNMDAFRKIYPGEFYKKFLDQKVRPDDRTLLQLRDTVISVGGTSTAYGSSLVKVGNTTVMCGIRGQVGLVPLVNDPTNPFDRRQLVVNLEMLPLCSPHIRAGRPTEKAQIVAQNLNDLCDNILDISSLHSTSDTSFSNNQIASWFLYADLYCLDYDGNIQDCASIALVAALKSTLLPSIVVSSSGEACISSEPQDRVVPLLLSHMPISTTFGIFEDFVFADPNLEEEGLLTGNLNVTYDEKGNLCCLNMPGGSTMSDEQIKECMRMAKSRVGPITAHIESVVKNRKKPQAAK